MDLRPCTRIMYVNHLIHAGNAITIFLADNIHFNVLLLNAPMYTK